MTRSGQPGFALAEPVRVKVVDRRGAGVAGASVTFVVTAAGGSVSPADVVTDSTGMAEAYWTLGPEPGLHELIVSYGRQSVTVRTEAVFSPGDALLKVSGGSTTIVAGGCTLPELVVRVTTGAGAPVAGAVVGFETVGGAGSVTPAVATTDAAGVARARWKVGDEGGISRVRAVLRNGSRSTVEFSAPTSAAAPGGYSVIGNQIHDPATCGPILFHGVTRPSLQWTPGGDERMARIADDLAIMRLWGVNLVRIPVTQVFWLAGNRQYDPTYRARVIDAVRKARALGLAVIIDNHASDRGDRDFAGVPDGQQMPDVNISLPFWREVATEFKNDGGVIFELYNEPHEVSWEVWLNGGDIPTGPHYPGGPVREGYRAAGMQQLYDAVRSVGARNLVLVSGTHWGYFLDEVPRYRVNGYNIVYASHPYDWPDKQPDTWEAAFGSLAATDPVIISEFGAYDCSRLSFYTAVLDYADRKGMSWVAWAWWTPPPVSATYDAEQRARDICHFPSLITDWDGTPSGSGQVIRDRLASYRN